MADKKELLESLLKYDTPSITNVLATYPNDKELCLGLYNPWQCNWYTDQLLRCMYPELGRRVGYAVTCVFGLPDPSYPNRTTMNDLFRAIEASPKPVVVVIKQDMPEKIKNKNGLSGGNMTTAFKTLGAVACISDGPSRDIDEIREMDFQYMLTGVSPGHGNLAVYAVNVPVSICGMDVAPGDIIHMDENGAVRFPQDKLEQVAEIAPKLAKAEERRMANIRKSKNAEQVIKAMAGFEIED